MTITKEQAIYKLNRTTEIIELVRNSTAKTLPTIDKINLLQELREIRRDLIEWRKENPNG